MSQIYTNVHKYKYTHLYTIIQFIDCYIIIQKYARLCTNMHQHQQMCTNMHKYSQMFTNITNVHKYTQTCIHLHKYAPNKKNIYAQLNANIHIYTPLYMIMHNKCDKLSHV